MAETTTTKLNAESHLLLDQPLLRMPYNLARGNFKNAQRQLEHQTTQLLKDLTSAQKSSSKSSSTTATTLSDLDAMIAKLQTLKRKLELVRADEQRLNAASKARIAHLQALFDVQSLVDVKYDEWSRIRLSRLLVDYLLRSGYERSAEHLARSKGIEELVDVEAFVAAGRIERSLREGRSVTLALAWCAQNGQSLKKIGVVGTGAGTGAGAQAAPAPVPGAGLEFELRLQQFVELVREGHKGNQRMEVDGGGVAVRDVGMGGGGEQKLIEARAHAKKYLSGGDIEVLGRAAGLLAYRPWDQVEPYASLYSPARWDHLANLFLTTHHTLFSLPPRPLLHIALSAGLSALKTPSCHSAYLSSTGNASSSTTSVCPICSTELNELARNVPYAHHTQSYVENDPVVLPNGRVYGRERLRNFNDKIGTEPGWIKDPVAGAKGLRWRESEIRKVFIM